MKWTKQRVNNVFFVLGVVMVVVMMFTFDVSFVELWDHLCHAGYWLLPIVGVWIIIYGINAWRGGVSSEVQKTLMSMSVSCVSIVSPSLAMH